MPPVASPSLAAPVVGSHFANAAAACLAIEQALPAIVQAMRNPQVCGSGFLYVVVMDPGILPGECRFDDAILVEHAIGDRTQWDADYAAFARAKAALCWRHGQDGQRLQYGMAHRLREGDSLLSGAVCLDGITVGVSGAEAWWDEAFATTIAANLRAISRGAHAQALKDRRLVAGAPTGAH
ncbi:MULTISPECIES: hypothetical protein [unclassified Rhizobacter]|uniref:hypothetical protein n=1 Tax=unclassified Rhizobacter TaxID=2640088 RepID=UPI0006FCF942|nr:MULTISPECIES: hypothetical protein [unclassified Rhizobacter]KQU65974.1 hypothetical protein ASC88_10320 [Rhizobacter sp. Root29]KQV97885.1 hypothetical protein ASC98_11330 [Rhizobacter sp. Root1238]KRB18728.1 hypothetical protein ASE08_05720 [Rhizobacter sp. Root16D2]